MDIYRPDSLSLVTLSCIYRLCRQARTYLIACSCPTCLKGNSRFIGKNLRLSWGMYEIFRRPDATFLFSLPSHIAVGLRDAKVVIDP